MEKMNNSLEEIWKKLERSKNILIPLHPKPDGDSLGSSLAVKYILEKILSVKTTVVSQDELSENLQEFAFSKEVEFGKKLDEINLEKFDTILFLDHGTLRGHPEKIEKKEFPKNTTIINIDHHDTNDFYGNLNYVDSKRTSCCSILVDILSEKGIKADEESSRRLLLGILTDSGFFLNDNTPDSMKKAAFLIDTGKIDYEKEFYSRIMGNSWKMKKFEGILIENMEMKNILGKNVVYTHISQEDIKKLDLNQAEIRLGISFLKDIKNTDIIITLSELGDQIKGSLRSVGIDTTLYSKEFGGGGHKEASAFYMKKISLQEAMKKVLSTIERVGINKI